MRDIYAYCLLVEEMPVVPDRPRGYAVVALDHPKSILNIGQALRASGCFGVAMMVVSGRRYERSSADTLKAHRHMPLLQTEDVFQAMPFDCVPVAIDLVPGAVPLYGYAHPERAFYVFGAEDATLGSRITDRCRDRVYVPMASGCMNLAACVNVVLYDRAAKQWERDAPMRGEAIPTEGRLDSILHNK